MRSLSILTTTAVLALVSAASAQNAGAPSNNQQAGNAAAPTVSSANPLQSSVQAYAAFHKDVDTLRTAEVGSAAQLETALDTAGRHNREAFTRGWMAYGAMTAAQSNTFVEGVREAAAYYGRDAVLRGMSVDTAWARTLRGGDEATRLVLQSANADAARIATVADRYQQLAYSLQRQRWANTVAPQQAQRISRVRGLSAGATDVTTADVANRLFVRPATYSPMTDPTSFGGRGFWDALRGRPATETVASVSAEWRVKPARAEAVNRMTTIAALQALDAADANRTQIDQLLTDRRSTDCIEVAQIQLYQCMSAARFRYENAFCLGQHALRDMGTCISGVSLPAVAQGATPIDANAAHAPARTASQP